VSQRLVATEQNFHQLSQNYKQKADEVRGVQQFLNRELKSSIWEGKAATSFKADWEKYDKVLGELHTLFDGLSKELKGREEWTREFEARRAKG
jgi:WXG100 family type VII secretion target